MDELKRTVLYEWHKKNGAKIVPFGGYEMPLYYSSIVNEHMAVRTSVGIFDVSHMGEIFIKGDGALDFIDYLFPAKLKGIPEGRVKYSFLLREDGGIVDDLLIYPFSSQEIMLVVNASNIEKDRKYIKSHLPKGLSCEVLSYGNIAVQGPNSYELLASFLNFSLSSLKFYTFKRDIKFEDKNIILSRTGYTGDLGFEIYAKEEDIPFIWEKLIEKKVTPCGLGARDTLRLEAGYPLYGHELSEEVNPIEAGLSHFIYWDKDFIGKGALIKIKEEGPNRKLIGFIMEKGVPRQGYKIFKNSNQIGQVTSGGFSPVLKKMIGMGYVTDLKVKEQDNIEIEIRDTRKEARIASLPFYKPKK